MKIRIKGNSIRFRLSKTEVDHFGKTGRLEEKTEFEKSNFIYALAAKKSGEKLSVDFTNETITLWIPEQLVKEWTSTNRVGFDGEQETGGGRKLFLLVEKDYKCLDKVAEDQSDNYENPLAVKNEVSATNYSNLDR
jgi:hypothetical protein